VVAVVAQPARRQDVWTSSTKPDMDNTITGSEVDIFATQPVQTDIIAGHWHSQYAQSFNPRSGPIVFNLDGDDNYVDLNSTFLKLTVCIVDTRPGKTPMANECVVAPTNNWLHTLFKQVNLSVGGKVVSQSHNDYPYKAYIETLLSYGVDARKTYLQGEGFYKDDDGHMDSLVEAENKGFRARRDLCKGSKLVELKGRLHLDLFNQPHLMLNKVPIRIALDRSKDEFCIMGNIADENGNQDHLKAVYGMEIHSAVLEFRKVTLAPTILYSHITTLNTTTAKYPIRRTSPLVFDINQGTSTHTRSPLLSGQLPHRITFGMVSNQAYNGTMNLNPFNFQNFNLESIQLTVGGKPVPMQPMKFNFTTGSYIDGFMSLFIGTGQYGSDEGNMITRGEYPNGFTLICFNLTPDLNFEDDHYNGMETGNVEVHFAFKTALTETINVIALAEFDNTIEIDRFRQVSIDYAA